MSTFPICYCSLNVSVDRTDGVTISDETCALLGRISGRTRRTSSPTNPSKSLNVIQRPRTNRRRFSSILLIRLQRFLKIFLTFLGVVHITWYCNHKILDPLPPQTVTSFMEDTLIVIPTTFGNPVIKGLNLIEVRVRVSNTNTSVQLILDFGHSDNIE